MTTTSPLRGPGPAVLDKPPSNRPSVAGSRKRSRSLIFREDEEHERQNEYAEDDLKRVRTTDELHTLRLVPSSEAWQLQAVTTDLLAAARHGLDNHVPGRSMIVLCVLEHVDIHFHLLCSILPQLRSLSPTLQPLLLTRHQPHYLLPRLHPVGVPPMPILTAKGSPHNHLLNLGLLQPLGGGQAGMDALVILDACGARRLVLPVGWGAGRHAAERVVQERLVECLVEAVEGLEREMRMR